ncbi:luciferin 4-monooxygenase-like [Galleria mellonella]|uniref:Luciferin 4-monooxygenase-like n=1 Tax=Galleria mellonella TaxID=7137 RepID=A0ABM3MKX2_GALME|nr:luciferin 4-monooxygenase-like [Galleria mellonella]
MPKRQRYNINNSVHWFMNELTSRVVAESGNPNDRYHLGKVLLQSFKDDPDLVTMIDGGTGESITNKEVLERSVRCANSLKNLGLKTGDVIILLGPNHINISIPFYAGLYLGIAVAPVDRTFGVRELQETFRADEPKIVFCQNEKAHDVDTALKGLNLDTKIITFDKGDYCNFSDFLKQYGGESKVEDFEVANFDPSETISFLVSTSGTTGLPKAAVVTHKNVISSFPYIWSKFDTFPAPTRLAVVVSPLQWLTAIAMFLMSPIFRFTRLQTSLALTQQHTYHLINTYRPSFLLISPTFAATLFRPGDRDNCDFTCFDIILIGGSAVPQTLIDEIKSIIPETEVLNVYGLSELSGVGLIHHFGDNAPRGSSGQPLGHTQCRLVNQDNEDILEPNVPGELWVKSLGLFKGYYNNPVATAETFSEDGWFRTGDSFYRDDNWNFYFTERIKLLLKYRNNQISPLEVENVIRQHPGVFDVAVTGIPDRECGDIPVACVVPKPGVSVKAQEIKDLVKASLSDDKQLRGGVIFLNELPINANTKLNRRKLKEMVLVMERE